MIATAQPLCQSAHRIPRRTSQSAAAVAGRVGDYMSGVRATAVEHVGSCTPSTASGRHLSRRPERGDLCKGPHARIDEVKLAVQKSRWKLYGATIFAIQYKHNYRQRGLMRAEFSLWIPTRGHSRRNSCWKGPGAHRRGSIGDAKRLYSSIPELDPTTAPPWQPCHRAARRAISSANGCFVQN